MSICAKRRFFVKMVHYVFAADVPVLDAQMPLLRLRQL
jgi:hypothetical protein